MKLFKANDGSCLKESEWNGGLDWAFRRQQLLMTELPETVPLIVLRETKVLTDPERVDPLVWDRNRDPD